jgi:hypothetical protein
MPWLRSEARLDLLLLLLLSLAGCLPGCCELRL